jgi:hypothetical protein
MMLCDRSVNSEARMASIFISYRRSDSMAETGRIYDRLVQAFGEKQIFKDVDNIPPGEDFRTVLDRALSAADVVLVIIGQSWSLIADSAGKRRLADPTDFVRIEVETALARKDVTVIPVLVDGANMPTADSLPDGLKDLAFRNSVVVRNDPDFNHDINMLIQTIQKRVDRPRRLPLVAAAVIGLIAVAALGLLALQGGATSTPTSTPTEVAQIATQEPSNTPAPTATSTPAATATATVLYPDGRLLQLLYNGVSFYIYNASVSSIPFNRLDLEALDSTGQRLDMSFDGSRWAQQFANLLRQGCGALEPTQFSGQLKPSECTQTNATTNRLSDNELFWRISESVTAFRIIWDDQEVARCPAVEATKRTKTTCEVRIPAS